MHIGVTGASGRMGREVLRAILDKKNDGIRLSAALLREGHDQVGVEVGPALGYESQGVRFTASPLEAFEASDVVIDFTSAEVLGAFLDIAYRTQTPLVIGTTGLVESHYMLLKKASSELPILYSQNMTFGIHLLASILENIAGALKEDFDTEIIDFHHRHKKDAPSGTSLLFGKAIAKGQNIPLQEIAVFNRSSARQSGEIGFSSVRAGNVYGEHTVLFASDDEILELSHRALTRSVFAKGAVKAALWLKSQKPGLYTFRDMIELK